MMKLLQILSVILSLSFLFSCEYLNLKEDTKEQETKKQEGPIARVANTYLYPSDLVGMLDRVEKADSASFVQRYIQTWIKKQLLVNKASSLMDIDQAEIERKVQDYRYALLVYQYQQQFILSELDTSVTNVKIEEYYQGNRDNFQLKQNIVKCRYVKLPKEAPRINRFEKLFKSKEEDEKEDLKSYCFRFANSYNIEDSTWVNFDDIVKNSPMASIPNKVQFLQQNRYIETEDEDFLYYLNILDYKIIDEISPLEFEKENIRNIIINRRKVELAEQLEEDIFKEAVKESEFEIF